MANSDDALTITYSFYALNAGGDGPDLDKPITENGGIPAAAGDYWVMASTAGGDNYTVEPDSIGGKVTILQSSSGWDAVSGGRNRVWSITHRAEPADGRHDWYDSAG